MGKSYYVYVWYRKTDGNPFYVGKGTGNRCYLLHNRNNYFMNVYRKHGAVVKIVQNRLTEDDALKLERELIMEYRGLYEMTNLTDGGEGVSGMSHSEETKELLSKLSRRQWSNPEIRMKLVESRRRTHRNPEFR